MTSKYGFSIVQGVCSELTLTIAITTVKATVFGTVDEPAVTTIVQSHNVTNGPQIKRYDTLGAHDPRGSWVTRESSPLHPTRVNTHAHPRARERCVPRDSRESRVTPPQRPPAPSFGDPR